MSSRIYTEPLACVLAYGADEVRERVPYRLTRLQDVLGESTERLVDDNEVRTDVVTRDFRSRERDLDVVVSDAFAGQSLPLVTRGAEPHKRVIHRVSN